MPKMTRMAHMTRHCGISKQHPTEQAGIGEGPAAPMGGGGHFPRRVGEQVIGPPLTVARAPGAGWRPADGLAVVAVSR